MRYYLNKKDKFAGVNIFNTTYYYFHDKVPLEHLATLETVADSIEGSSGTVFASSKLEVLETIRKSEVKWIDPNAVPDLADYLWGRVTTANEQSGWNFDVRGFGENFQYTIYDGSKDGFYNSHRDLEDSVPYRKLSIVVQLSEATDYEGGDLHLEGSHIIPELKERGSVIIFPSFKMHRIDPVTSGTRKSLVIWVTGPPFR